MGAKTIMSRLFLVKSKGNTVTFTYNATVRQAAVPIVSIITGRMYIMYLGTYECLTQQNIASNDAFGVYKSLL